jgi:hypothetical protein
MWVAVIEFRAVGPEPIVVGVFKVSADDLARWAEQVYEVARRIAER